MAFFTSQQLFGNGAGAPGSPGWVPIDTSAPPAYSANNRGIAFGEQLSSAIANRSHYALAQNDDDLNTRLASFEVGGLDAAYDLGTVGPAGGGRIIEKDGGAVETTSILSTQYSDDVANAHFRAQQSSDLVGGGVGFESVGFGRSGTGSPLLGFLDRRGLSFNDQTIIADTIAVTLNPGGLLADGLSIGAGVFKTFLNSDLILGYDMVEIFGGPTAGLYVIRTLPTTVQCTLLKLDGTTPAFAVSEVTTIRVFRPTFGTFNYFGHSGTLPYSGTVVAGVPGQESAFDFVPGSKLGRHATALSSTDGARFAWRVRWKLLTGAVSTVVECDSQGQIASYVSSDQLTTEQRGAFTNFGAAAFLVTQNESSAAAESGFIARSVGELEQWFGLAAVGDARPSTTPAGEFAFNFINPATFPPFNVDLTDTVAADWCVNPSITLVEILTPSAQAGIYLVNTRDTNNGRLELRDIEGVAVVGFPTVGAGTLRVLYVCSMGARDFDVGTAGVTGALATGRAGAVLMAPKTPGSAALLLEAGNANADPTDQWFIRSVRAEDGSSAEVFGVTSDGKIIGTNHQYPTMRQATIVINLQDAIPNGAEWIHDANLWQSGVNPGALIIPISKYLTTGMIITGFDISLEPGVARAVVGNRMQLGLNRSTPNFAVPNSPSYVQINPVLTDNGAAAAQTRSAAGLAEVVDRSTTNYSFFIYSGTGAGVDLLYAIRINVNIPDVNSN